MTPTFGARKTPHGHTFGDVTSALQKAIRRGKEREALYWASQLDKADHGLYVWRRLRIIASEDVGLADSNVTVQVSTLYENWLDARAKGNVDMQRRWPRVFLTHAVLLLARAPKSRIVDHAAMVVYDGEERHEVPDYALDKHTREGRRQGRGMEHFFDVSMKLENERLPDGYREEARALKVKQEHEQLSM